MNRNPCTGKHERRARYRNRTDGSVKRVLPPGHRLNPGHIQLVEIFVVRDEDSQVQRLTDGAIVNDHLEDIDIADGRANPLVCRPEELPHKVRQGTLNAIRQVQRDPFSYRPYVSETNVYKDRLRQWAKEVLKEKMRERENLDRAIADLEDMIRRLG